jgi:hypothetical protein
VIETRHPPPWNRRVPTWLAITIIAAFTWLAILGWYVLGSQTRHLRQVGDWLQSTRGSWEELCAKYPELEQVEVYGYTGGDGSVGISIGGFLSKDAMLAFHDWLLKSRPPRPVGMYRNHATVVDAVTKVDELWFPRDMAKAMTEPAAPVGAE